MTSKSNALAVIVSASERLNGVKSPYVIRSMPARTEADGAHRPVIIWNAPSVLALYSLGESSETRAFCEGSMAPLCKPWKANSTATEAIEVAYGKPKQTSAQTIHRFEDAEVSSSVLVCGDVCDYGVSWCASHLPDRSNT